MEYERKSKESLESFDTGFELLDFYKKNALSVYKQKEKKESLKKKFLGILIQDHRYLLEVSHLYHIVNLSKIESIPYSISWIQGVSHINGNLYPVIDLYQYIFNQKKKSSSEYKRVVILNAKKGLIGILVDYCYGILSFEESQKKLIDSSEKSFKDFLINRYQNQGESFYHINIEKLLNKLDEESYCEKRVF